MRLPARVAGASAISAQSRMRAGDRECTVAGVRRAAIAIAAVALALPSSAAAERLPILEITGSGSIEQTWDWPRHPIDPPSCGGQEFREGHGRQLQTWSMERTRVKVERWEDSGSVGFIESAKVRSKTTRQATQLWIDEPGECDPEGRVTDDAVGCKTVTGRSTITVGMREHRFYLAGFGSPYISGCPIWEHGGGKDTAKVTERRLRRQKKIVLRNAETIRTEQFDEDDANTVKRIKWTVTLKRVGWYSSRR
jgi:hypothetical protein